MCLVGRYTLLNQSIHILSSAFGGFATDRHRGSIPGPRWGTFVPTPNLPTPVKNSAGIHGKDDKHEKKVGQEKGWRAPKGVGEHKDVVDRGTTPPL